MCSALAAARFPPPKWNGAFSPGASAPGRRSSSTIRAAPTWRPASSLISTTTDSRPRALPCSTAGSPSGRGGGGRREFLVAPGDPANNALVEALEPSQHFGGAKFFDRAGHIPNAIMMPTADFYNSDKTFKSAQELRRMLAYLGVKPDQQG